MSNTAGNPVVIVTGGGSGIGLECAKQLAEQGASVAILDVSASAADSAVSQLRTGRHLALEADVTDSDAMRKAVRAVASELGGITAVVAAAGMVSRTPLKDVSDEEFRRVFAVNVEGMQNTIAAAAPHLIAAGTDAAIVALGSVAASTGGGLMGSGLYAASKAAVVGLIRGYARELAPWGVRANVVAPAATDTPMTRALSEEERARIAGMSLIGRLSRPEEIASTVVFLLGPGAGSITGQVIQPNGGVYFN
jgi:NAD(P)-dependent dehydrogenase (short-subunit alcohol dehydrogenase family)